MTEDGLVASELWLVRHGETEWSAAGRHTGRTDVPLTDRGRGQARALGRAMTGETFARVFVSPLRRALDTCHLAGLGDAAVVLDALAEWDYGDYEGRTTADIREEHPGWTVWHGPVPGGETVTEVGARAGRVIEQATRAADDDGPGPVALFGHGHLLRVLSACWLGLEPDAGRLLALDTATLSVLGWERETKVLRRWNLTPRDGAP